MNSGGGALFDSGHAGFWRTVFFKPGIENYQTFEVCCFRKETADPFFSGRGPVSHCGVFAAPKNAALENNETAGQAGDCDRIRIFTGQRLHDLW